ncbi:MAG: lipase family protein [Clostridia bacterium]|nr:lipase family protein [Clostridia bacterium]
MNLLQLFQKCTSQNYIHVENSGDYFIERDGDSLYIYLECSNGIEDWKNNFNFPAKPYKRMGKAVWFAHRGFLKVWKSIEPYIERHVKDKSVNNITIVGYSHGAALAVFCHEYAWYHRPDIRNNLLGYGFGCPRVFWGIKSKQIKQRWDRFKIIRNIDDIVTHVPPLLFGFSHIGTMIEIGRKGKYNPIDAHRPENIVAELEIIEKSNK